MRDFDISVIIATRDRPDLLRDCVATLAAQRTALQIIVVDDGSEPAVDAETIRGAAGGHEVIVHRIGGAGLAAARNAGAALARAEIIAFLDDDTLVAAGWGSALMQAFETRQVIAAAGRIKLTFETQPPAWLDAGLHGYLSAFDRGAHSEELPAGVSPVGANCAVRASAWRSTGGFDGTLGRQGGSLLSAEDTAFFLGLHDLVDGTTVYVADAVVHHRVAPQRLALRWFMQRGRAQGISDQMIDSTPRARRLLLLVRWFAGVPLIALRDVRTPRRLAHAAIWCAYCAGRARGEFLRR